MRLSACLLVLSLAGIVAGGFLIGRWALGAAIVADSVAVGAWALLRDAESRPEPSVRELPTLGSILERARRAG